MPIPLPKGTSPSPSSFTPPPRPVPPPASEAAEADLLDLLTSDEIAPPSRGGRPGLNGGSVLAVLGRNTMTAAAIVAALRKRNRGMSEGAAARALHRAVLAKQVASTNPVTLGGGRMYLYWSRQDHDVELRAAVIMRHLKERPALRSLFEALVTFKGRVPQDFAQRCTSAPTSDIPGHVGFRRVVEELKQLDVIRVSSDPLYGFSICLEPKLRRLLNAQEASRFSWPTRLRAESLALEMAAQWLQVTSLAAWKCVQVRNGSDGAPVVFNNYCFDLMAPCYVAPIAGIRPGPDGKRKAGFLLADLTIGRCEPWMARNLLQKLTEVRSRRNPPSIIGCYFAGSFMKEALTSLRRAGVLVVPLDRIGSNSLVAIVRAMAAVHVLALVAPGKVKLEQALKAMTQLANNRDGNLAGRLFEFIMARSLEVDGLTITDIGRTLSVTDSDGKARKIEVDVIARDHTLKHWTAISAKGYNALQPVREDEVKEWFGDRIALVQRYLKDRSSEARKFTFIFATSSYFDAKAQAYLDGIKARFTGKVQIEWWDGKALREQWNANDHRELIADLERFYGRPGDAYFSVERGVVAEREAKAPELGVGQPPRPTQAEVRYQPTEVDLQAVRSENIPNDVLAEVDRVVRDMVELPDPDGAGKATSAST